MDIESAAKDLGKLIAQTPEYKYYTAATREVDDDKETLESMRKLKEMEEKVVKAQHDGQEIDEETRKEYTETMQEVQGKPKIQALISGQENYMKLMNSVNNRISEGIQEGAQSRIITNF
ncbi:MAG: YlbF family regulator [Candidatus Glassbacteria bacterium]|nr:YlbF family regulator [Candidatus Glassbacteria bacterium]